MEGTFLMCTESVTVYRFSTALSFICFLTALIATFFLTMINFLVPRYN